MNKRYIIFTEFFAELAASQNVWYEERVSVLGWPAFALV